MSHVAYLAIVLLPGALSQTTTTAICTVNSVNWTFNSLGVSPCQVTADLGGACSGGIFNTGPLPIGFVYSLHSHNPCLCNTVYYSLESACAACQDREWLDWAIYNENCTTTYPGVFPLPIPTGTRVPGWAYADVTVTDRFNLTVAQSLDLRPESTGITSSTSSFSLPTSSTSSGTTSLTASSTSLISSTPPSTSPTSGQSGSSSGSNVGATVGGVIGGVFGLALIGGIIFCFLRRRRQRSQQQPPYSAFNTTPYLAAPHNPDQNMSYNPPGTRKPLRKSQPISIPAVTRPVNSTGFPNPYSSLPPVTPPIPVTPAHQTLYDPSDPSTFPSNTPAPSYTSNLSPLPQAQTHSPFQGLATQAGQHSPQKHMPGPTPAGRYTGVPELS